MTEDQKKGLASVLGAVFVVAILVGITGSVPDPVPEWALEQEVVYRLEVTLAIFILLYVPVAAVALARQGRLFTKFGAGPASAEAEALAAAEENTGALDDITEGLQQVRGSVGLTLAALGALSDRVAALETETESPRNQ